MNIATVVGLIKALAPGVDPADVEQAVSDWLDDHPEATTTVEDGSITAEKLASALAAKIGEIDDKYEKPSGGIPATDLAESYIEEPSSEGTNGQVLTTDGNGGRTWTTVQGGGGASIDDTAGEGDTTVVWSADKTATEVSSLSEAIENQPDIKTTDANSVDLDICDENGHVLLRLKDGQIKTKMFDSSEAKPIRTRMAFGAHNGAEYFAPECTVPAYRIAGQQGWEWAWIAGIDFSTDGTMYVIHDDTVDRTTDGTGYLNQMSDVQINALNIDQTGAGYSLSDFDSSELKIPTLEQVVQQCVRYGMKMVLRLSLFPNLYDTAEHKAVWDGLAELLNGYGVQPEDISCYLDSGNKASTCRTIFGNDVEVSTFLGVNATAQNYIDWFEERSLTGKRAAIINYANLNLAAVKLLHTNGIRVYAFDSSASEEHASDSASMGVDIYQNGRYHTINN